MKVLFLNPPFFRRFSREQRSPAVTKSGTLYYPKWLALAAGVAIQQGHDVHLLDCPAAGHSIDYVIDYIEQNNIAAVVCDTSTPSINNDVRVLETIADRHPDVHTLMVGRHVSAMPNETFAMSAAVKALALREYEFTVCDWLAALESGASFDDVTGISWRNAAGEIITNKPRQPLENLDELPFVSEVYKRFLHIPDYFYGHSLHPLVVFDTSRGCPYHCSFCVYPQTFSGHVLRHRSVENIADEFDFVAREMPEVKAIMLEDDTFVVNLKHTRSLAEELIRRGNRIPFDSNCRADPNIGVEFLQLLHQAGARLFCVGFESGDVDVIRKMRKNNNHSKDSTYIDGAKQFVQNCQSAGIMVHGCFMIGNLNETHETINTTIDFAIDLRPDTAQFFPIMVYPGTEAYEEAKRNGWLASENFSDWLTEDGLHNSVVNLPGMTHRELVEYCDLARRKFYLNPRYLAYKAMQSVKSKDELVRNVKGARVLAGHLLRGSFKSA